MNRLFLLAAGMFAMGCEDYLFAGLLPGISTSLHISVVAAAQGCTVFGLAYLASVPLCALLLTRKPARDVLILALATFILGDVLTLFSQGLPVYLSGRFLAGLGSGLFLPVAVAAGVSLADSDSKGLALSWMWGANSVGAVIGVPLGLWIASMAGWHTTVVMILGLASFVLIGLLARKQTLFAEAAPPSLNEQLRLLLDRRVLAIVGVTILTATGCLGLYSYVSQVLVGTKIEPDFAFSLWSFGGLIGSIGVGYVLDRFNQPRLLMAVILVILFAMIVSIPTLRWIPWLGLLPFLVWGSMGWASVTPQQYILMKIKPEHSALLVALISSAVSLGGAAGTALGGLALASGLRAEYLPYLTGVFVLGALGCQVWVMQSREV